MKLVNVIENEDTLGLEVVEGKPKKPSADDVTINKFLGSLKPGGRLLKKALMTVIENHPLYIAPPTDVSELFRFGWARGIAFKMETLIQDDG